jgi:hypothetical protein
MFHIKYFMCFFPGGGGRRKLKQKIEGGAQGVKVWEPLL